MAIRLRDIVEPDLDRVRRVIDLSSGDAGLAAGLRLRDPKAVRILRRMPRDGAEEGDLVLLPVRAEEIDASRAGALSKAMASLRLGALCVLLVEVPPAELPVPVLTDILSRARCQVLAAVPLVGPGVPVGILVERVEAPRPVRGYLLDTDATPPADADPSEGPLLATLRLYAEHQLSALEARALRARLGPADSAPATADAVARDALQARLTKLESSAALAAGEVLVRAARHPVKGTLTLPRDLVRLRRARRKAAARG